MLAAAPNTWIHNQPLVNSRLHHNTAAIEWGPDAASLALMSSASSPKRRNRGAEAGGEEEDEGLDGGSMGDGQTDQSFTASVPQLLGQAAAYLAPLLTPLRHPRPSAKPKSKVHEGADAKPSYINSINYDQTVSVLSRAS